LAFSRTAK
jgi:2-polyprenyl-6-methoxyphenol hydroxylase-like FAD-dependent oxidoreductase